MRPRWNAAVEADRRFRASLGAGIPACAGLRVWSYAAAVASAELDSQQYRPRASVVEGPTFQRGSLTFHPIRPMRMRSRDLSAAAGGRSMLRWCSTLPRGHATVIPGGDRFPGDVVANGVEKTGAGRHTVRRPSGRMASAASRLPPVNLTAERSSSRSTG